MDGITNISSTPASAVVTNAAASTDGSTLQKGTEKKSTIKLPIDKAGQSAQSSGTDTNHSVPGEPKLPIDESAVERAVKQANQAVAGTQDKVSFGFDKSKGQLYVKVTDATTGRVVQTFPAGAFVDHLTNTHSVNGLLLNRKG